MNKEKILNEQVGFVTAEQINDLKDDVIQALSKVQDLYNQQHKACFKMPGVDRAEFDILCKISVCLNSIDYIDDQLAFTVDLRIDNQDDKHEL